MRSLLSLLQHMPKLRHLTIRLEPCANRLDALPQDPTTPFIQALIATPGLWPDLTGLNIVLRLRTLKLITLLLKARWEQAHISGLGGKDLVVELHWILLAHFLEILVVSSIDYLSITLYQCLIPRNRVKIAHPVNRPQRKRLIKNTNLHWLVKHGP